MNKSAWWLRGAVSVAVVVGVLAACGGGGGELTPVNLSMSKIGGYDGLVLGASEITAYDAQSKRLFVVNGANANVDVLDLSDPTNPVKVSTIDISALGGGVNSVSVHDGLVALAIEANPKTSPGKVAFYNAHNLNLLAQVTVGAQPDMILFTSDGRKVLTANEGEPHSYNNVSVTSVDPEGSISIITVNRTGGSTDMAVAPSLATAGFASFNGQMAQLRAQGVRIYGPNATVAQDLEPEYITLSDDNRTAYVTLQENNAIAIVDVDGAAVTAIHALGTKDHSVAGYGLDPSDEDGGTDTNSGSPLAKIGTWPVRGMYLPDGIASYKVNNKTYLITANEGDAREDWPGFKEETRIRAYCTGGLDPAVFAGATGLASDPLLFDSNLGRLRITMAPNGDDSGRNASNQCTKLYAFGGRSFSIWGADLGVIQRVYDSGDQLEQRTLSLPNVNFNASHDNNTLDARSPNKGPEPEGVVVARFGAKTYAFIGMERVGGVMVYDVSNPAAPTYVTYLNTRSGATGDRGPEGLHFISASRSPNGKPLLVVGNEVSGTTAVFQINLTY
jgi:hypothetical protein